MLSVFVRLKKKDNNKKKKEAEKRTDEKEVTKLNQRNFNRDNIMNCSRTAEDMFMLKFL